jgi:outer membrane protein OmpA-like peptidoglycan-associated protein
MPQVSPYMPLLLAVLITGHSNLPAKDAASAEKSGEAPSLVSLSSGALLVQKPQEYGNNWSAFWILDERANTGWATPKGVIGSQVIVIELAQKAVLKSLEFDTAGVDGAGRAAKEILVEMSDTSATTGFSRIAEVTLADHTNNQQFPTSAEVPGRWVRLTVKNNYGSPDYVELMDFRARGKQLGSTAFPDVSGTYSTNYGDMHLRQQGNSIVGCYEYSNGLLAGAIDGSVMKLTWRQSNPSEGPAMMVFSGDGRQLFGLWWYKGNENGSGSQWTGTKKSNTVGTCPHWTGDVQQQMSNDLDERGTTLVYGIVFDTDSDHIKDESRPTLDKIVALLKARPDLKLAVEGHTDLTGNAAHNQELSERRAKSVIVYLSGAGIAAERLSPVGYGATRPVASNDTALGRAQNRRVVLTKK